MNLTYLDSSILLSIILNDYNSNLSKSIFKKYIWASSKLLLFECSNVIVREGQKQKSPNKIISNSLSYLNKLVEYVNIIPMDDNVLDKFLSDKRISQGRTLDAIHIASAFHIQDNYEGKLSFATYDKKLEKVVFEMGFPLIDLNINSR